MSGFSLRREASALRRASAIGALLLAGGLPPAYAADVALRLTDAAGVVHFTNVPADPRYRTLRRMPPDLSPDRRRLPARTGMTYIADIRAIARQYDVSPVLIEAVMHIESGFDPGAVSPKGAGGLMQLTPNTAGALGVVDRFDPHESIRGGVRHLRYLLDRYHGSVVLALAAYNAGEGAVDAHRGVPPYPETERYVQRVLQRAGLTESLTGQGALCRSVGPDHFLTYSYRLTSDTDTLSQRCGHRATIDGPSNGQQ